MSSAQDAIDDIIRDDEYTYLGPVLKPRVKCASLEAHCDCTGVEAVTDSDGVARTMCLEHARATASKHTRMVECSNCHAEHGIFRTSDKDMRRVQCPRCWVWHGV